MHRSVFLWVGLRARRLRLNVEIVRVLDVGSFDENGSVRPHFNRVGYYVGVDPRPGPTVDCVSDGHALPFRDASFDVAVCTEVLEHDTHFWRTMAEIGRVLRPGAIVLVTTRGNGFPEHRFPIDVYRFMPDSASVLMDLAGCELLEVANDGEGPGIFVAGRRDGRRLQA